MLVIKIKAQGDLVAIGVGFAILDYVKDNGKEWQGLLLANSTKNLATTITNLKKDLRSYGNTLLNVVLVDTTTKKALNITNIDSATAVELIRNQKNPNKYQSLLNKANSTKCVQAYIQKQKLEWCNGTCKRLGYNVDAYTNQKFNSNDTPALLYKTYKQKNGKALMVETLKANTVGRF